MVNINTPQEDKKTVHDELLEQRSNILDAMEKLTDAPGGQDSEGNPTGQLTEEQQKDFENREQELVSLDRRISQSLKVRELRQKQADLSNQLSTLQTTPRLVPDPANTGLSNGELKDLRNFSFGRAIIEVANGRTPSGIEAEVSQEGLKEVRNWAQYGVQAEPNAFILPKNLMRTWAQSEQRARYEELETRGNTATGAGQRFVSEMSVNIVEAMFDSTHVRQMGAVVYEDLVPNIKVPRIVKQTPPSGKPENGAADPYVWDVQGPNLTPKRLPVDMPVSNQLLIQSQERNLEQMFRIHGFDMLSQQIERAFVNGTGTNEATGIIGAAGVTVVPGGTDGAAPTWAHVLQLEEGPDTNNADDQSRYYYFNAKVKRKFKETPKVAGTDSVMILDEGKGRILNDHPYRWSNAVPSDLTKGAGSNLSACIHGDFRGYVIGQWTGIQFRVNPYNNMSEGQTIIHMVAYYDGAVQDPNKFAVMQDIITT